jgi:hypothetical protein
MSNRSNKYKRFDPGRWRQEHKDPVFGLPHIEHLVDTPQFHHQGLRIETWRFRLHFQPLGYEIKLSVAAGPPGPSPAHHSAYAAIVANFSFWWPVVFSTVWSFNPTKWDQTPAEYLHLNEIKLHSAAVPHQWIIDAEYDQDSYCRIPMSEWEVQDVEFYM